MSMLRKSARVTAAALLLGAASWAEAQSSHFDPAIRAAQEARTRAEITERYRTPDSRERSRSEKGVVTLVLVGVGLWLARRRLSAPGAGLAILAVALPACAQMREYRDERFRFSYPAGWQVRPGGAIPGVVSLQLSPGGNATPRMLMMYRRMEPSTRCYWLHPNYMEEFVKDDTAIAWRRVGSDVTESLPAGEAFTTTFRRDHGQPATNIATAACSAGNTMLMVYEYDHRMAQDTSVRDSIVRSLVLGDGSLAGQWYGQGSVLNLDASGRAHLNWATGNYATDSRLGTWSQQGRQLQLNWHAGSGRPAESVTCEIESILAGRMKTRCSDLPGVVTYVRH